MEVLSTLLAPLLAINPQKDTTEVIDYYGVDEHNRVFISVGFDIYGERR